MKNIIINADDFGICSAVNKAIVKLFLNGALSSATLMVNTEGTEEAVTLAKKHHIPIGLHFNLTLNNPPYHDRGDFERKYFARKITSAYILTELKKQYQYLLDKGLTPTHIDSHQHIHNLPGIFRIVGRFAKQKNIPVRIPEEWPILNTYDDFSLNDLKYLARKIINLFFSKINKLQALFLWIKTNSNLISVFALLPRPAELQEKQLELLLKKCQNNTEYMCHPTASADAMIGRTSIGLISFQEYSLMTKESFLAMIKSHKIKLINYGGL